MANIVKISALVLVILGLGACIIANDDYRDGNPYLLFDWTTAPTTFSTTAPGVPLIVNQREEYLTEEGTWYAEYYHTSSDTTRWIYFTITVYPAQPLADGKDSIFEIYLYATGDPTFIQLRSLTPVAPASADHITAAEQPLDTTGYDQQTLGSFEQVRGGYKMTGTYGVYVPKE